ncbi:hypothetical protein MTP99_015037 [Tenebrio molitor]|jgi:hypothetical protein|nr:hypothetical protein MTP99_015037 [Tenebrio molitor]
MLPVEGDVAVHKPSRRNRRTLDLVENDCTSDPEGKFLVWHELSTPRPKTNKNLVIRKSMAKRHPNHSFQTLDFDLRKNKNKILLIDRLQFNE